jgi:hypothetical protein
VAAREFTLGNEAEELSGDTEVMTVTLKDVDNRNLWWTRLEPALGLI